MSVGDNIKAVFPAKVPAHSNLSKVSAFLWIDRAPRAFNETLRLLSFMENVETVFCAFSDELYRSDILVKDKKIVLLSETNLVAAAKQAMAAAGELFLFVAAPIRLSRDSLDLATAWMEDDPRIGTMSFMSNAGGYISFPHRNGETPFGVDGHDETSLTRLLRLRKPLNFRPTPLPVAEGAAVLVNRSVLEICGGFKDASTNSLSFVLADLSLRGARRGFNNFFDSFTFLSVPFDGVGPFLSVLKNPEARHALHTRHPSFPAMHDSERDRGNSIVAQALDWARAKALGLRILIDGSALGPKEMGTQMLIVNLTRALADREEIQWVAVGVPDPKNIPQYAQELSLLRKVRFVSVGNLDFPEAAQADIIHRPFQPSGPLPWDRWSELAKRSIITVQDLIAYRNAAYFKDWNEWDQYRDNFNRQIACCDAVFSISHDVVTSIREERLPVDEQRIFVVENGADARSKDQPTRIPDEIMRRGWSASPFLFVLGATYAHKNRDAAMRVWARLREKGFNHKLVMVGASVPYGSTRAEEAILTTSDLVDNLLVLPEVSSEERNWLLMNANLALYLTAAEGFGQVPFEAARMDVPTLFVSFGPFRELIDDSSLPLSFDIDGLTARAEDLLNDVNVARESIRSTLKNIGQLTWAETARKSVDAYFSILSQPARIFRS